MEPSLLSPLIINQRTVLPGVRTGQSAPALVIIPLSERIIFMKKKDLVCSIPPSENSEKVTEILFTFSCE